MNPRHLMVYVKWPVIQEWKRRQRSERFDLTEPALPFAYASDQVRLFQRARPGDVVWVLSAPRFADYRLPPSLIARLQVHDVVDRQSPCSADVPIPKAVEGLGRYVVLANRSQSAYYPLNNAYHTLLSLTFAGKAPTLRNCPHCKRLYEAGQGLYAGIPAHLQTVRQLAPGSGAIMDTFARTVESGHIAFLSYRRREAGPRAMKLVEGLTDNEVSCWYDHWMIPEPVAKGDVLIDDDLLSAALTDGLRQSTYFVALVTPTYHRAKWTAQEWQSAVEERTSPRRRRPLWLVEIAMGGKASDQADIVIQDEGNDLGEQLLARL